MSDMSKFANKIKNAFQNFHLEQPGVGRGVGGQHGGIGANDCYTSSRGNRWEENERVSTRPLEGSVHTTGRRLTPTEDRSSTSS